MKRRHEDTDHVYIVNATSSLGTSLRRVTDGAGVRLMRECGYRFDSVRKVEKLAPGYPPHAGSAAVR